MLIAGITKLITQPVIPISLTNCGNQLCNSTFYSQTHNASPTPETSTFRNILEGISRPFPLIIS